MWRLFTYLAVFFYLFSYNSSIYLTPSTLRRVRIITSWSNFFFDFTVTVNGITKKFINGIGYGIDGYCCEVGDKLRAEGKQNINYAGIAIKGLLFHFKTKNATVIADGKEFKFNKVWLAPTMLGRYYGGGMIPTPDQKKIKYKQTSFVYGFIRFGQIKNAYGFS